MVAMPVWDRGELESELREMADDIGGELGELLRHAADEIEKQREFADASRQEANSLRTECQGNRERVARAVDILCERD
jgi:hypothetical protein